jgi:hypothetical protein
VWRETASSLKVSRLPAAGSSDGSDPEAEPGQRVSRDRVFYQRAKVLYPLASEPSFGHDEIVVLILRGGEAEPVLSGDSLDRNRNPPIDPVLRDGDTNGSMRLRLRPVIWRLCTSE